MLVYLKFWILSINIKAYRSGGSMVLFIACSFTEDSLWAKWYCVFTVVTKPISDLLCHIFANSLSIQTIGKMLLGTLPCMATRRWWQQSQCIASLQWKLLTTVADTILVPQCFNFCCCFVVLISILECTGLHIAIHVG